MSDMAPKFHPLGSLQMDFMNVWLLWAEYKNRINIFIHPYIWNSLPPFCRSTHGCAVLHEFGPLKDQRVDHWTIITHWTLVFSSYVACFQVIWLRHNLHQAEPDAGDNHCGDEFLHLSQQQEKGRTAFLLLLIDDRPISPSWAKPWCLSPEHSVLCGQT